MDGNEIWEILFGILKGDVPDALTPEVLDQLAAALSDTPPLDNEETEALRAEAINDLRYLEGAEAHADEGPLGEPAARSILNIALRLARQRAENPRVGNPTAKGCPRAGRLHAPLRFCPDCPEGDACELPSAEKGGA